MRSAVALLCILVLSGGCRRAAKLHESEAVTSARSASILGSWILSNPDSTQFVGARDVELRLEPGSFTLIANYPGSTLLVVDGEATFDPAGGLLTLTPRSTTRPSSGNDAPIIRVGQPITLLATAADNTMVFAEPNDALGVPSSVWHRSSAARRSGSAATLSQRDSQPEP